MKPEGGAARFTLQVQVTGMCLLVVESRTQHLWVIMPNAAHHHHGGGHHVVPRHIPAIRYDEGLEQDPPRPSGRQRWRELMPLTRSLAGGDRSNARTLLRRVRGNLSRRHGRHAPVRWFQDALSPADEALIAARAPLAGVTDLVPEGGKEWIYGPDRTVLDLSAHCTIPNVPGRSIVVETRTGRVELFADASGTLRLDVCNLPANELNGMPDMSKPNRGQPPLHWEPYRALLDITDDVRPLRPDDDPDDDGGAGTTPPGTGMGAMAGINPYSCMIVPACPEDDPTCWDPGFSPTP